MSEGSSEVTTMTLKPNGPILVDGVFELLSADGQNLADGKTRVALCRCGASAKKPFCDGSHGSIGFEG